MRVHPDTIDPKRFPGLHRIARRRMLAVEDGEYIAYYPAAMSDSGEDSLCLGTVDNPEGAEQCLQDGIGPETWGVKPRSKALGARRSDVVDTATVYACPCCGASGEDNLWPQEGERGSWSGWCRLCGTLCWEENGGNGVYLEFHTPALVVARLCWRRITGKIDADR